MEAEIVNDEAFNDFPKNIGKVTILIRSMSLTLQVTILYKRLYVSAMKIYQPILKHPIH